MRRTALLVSAALSITLLPLTAAAPPASGAMKCAVLIVSGRPQLVEDERPAGTDALVASWLPGAEGDGVADVLYGKRALEGAAILRALGIEARAAAERAGAQQAGRALVTRARLIVQHKAAGTGLTEAVAELFAEAGHCC
ncbi:glycoside hydrolase family 3 C-terminal domain-containing protein [Streptomyces sp. NPDC048384]|uniref:glycoside hydrolase family 3 C-terminal domain-containing protein n=1 Tax=Streptomyces sp. NPDC048384 TaxID=3155487 RepID=UPI00341D2D8C